MTLRWDLMEPEWLDRSVVWIEAHGHHPYVLAEDWEAAQLRRDYGAANTVARLDWTPIVTLRGGTIRLYDAVRRTTGPPPADLSEAPRSLACPAPARMQPFAWR
jgi:hypothetical protein